MCLLFFQALLFVGYLYAHGLVQRGSLRGQWRIHSGLLAVALLAPIWPSTAWKPTGDGDPTTAILGLLAWHVGLPYLLLSATGPLLQVWFARAFPGESPYRLYALSNLGSLLGLVSYPFVVDVWLSAQQQVTLWWSGFLGYSLLCVACARSLVVHVWRWRRRGPCPNHGSPRREPRGPLGGKAPPQGKAWPLRGYLGPIIKATERG